MRESEQSEKLEKNENLWVALKFSGGNVPLLTALFSCYLMNENPNCVSGVQERILVNFWSNLSPLYELNFE